MRSEHGRSALELLGGCLVAVVALLLIGALFVFVLKLTGILLALLLPVLVVVGIVVFVLWLLGWRPPSQQ